LNRAILEVASALPPNVARFAMSQCTFIGFDRHTRGLALRAYRVQRGGSLIVLDEMASIWDLHSIVAHELAHAWLHHDGRDESGTHEREACALVQEWGFNGIGADADQAVSGAAAFHAPSGACPVPRASFRVEHGELRVACGYCSQDAELFPPALDMPEPELIARCPPERCDWLSALQPRFECPDCGASSEVSWVRHPRWRAITAGRVVGVLRILTRDVLGLVRGAGWPRDPALLRVSCRPCKAEMVLPIRHGEWRAAGELLCLSDRRR
jgi:hypothetical protein